MSAILDFVSMDVPGSISKLDHPFDTSIEAKSFWGGGSFVSDAL